MTHPNHRTTSLRTAFRFRQTAAVFCILIPGLITAAETDLKPGADAPPPTWERNDDPYPVEYDILYKQAIDLIQNSDWAAAFEKLNRAIDLVPYRPEAYFIYGRAHLMRDELAAAEKAFRTTVKIDSGFSSAWYELAQLVALKGDLIDALEYTRKAITLTNGQNWKFLTLLGELTAETGDRQATETAFDDAIAILTKRCDIIENAIRNREREEETSEIIVDTDYYVVYQEMIEVPNIRHETRHRVAPEEWVKDLERHQKDLAQVTARKASVLAWMDSEMD